jgi:hypothetical protein
MDEDKVLERIFKRMERRLHCHLGPAYSVTDMWVLLKMLNGPHYESAHITSTKQKTRVTSFLLPNTEKSHSILRI